ncbi:UvrD-helicase domain-containing protein [Olsenella massiliensis]|uniref:UvrD-helicase domain-containing protein n=1 Tax=Olsenella massiliensis TaxID=1622075 RepID=UPI00071C505F|nr:UvrD-helicase domain-containing protein [Olsenella massiliensis]
MSRVDLTGLSDEQRRIAMSLGEPLFVEAGAGSGKTFTLTRRLAWALSPGSGPDGGPFLDDLSQALVITFTNAAAREIRERVRGTLRAAGMREALLGVDAAWISTIHGMCARILRRHALDLGIDPEFAMAGANEEQLLKGRALEEVVGSAFRARRGDRGLSLLFGEASLGVERPGARRSGALGMVERLYDLSRTLPDGFDGIRLAAPADVAATMDALLLSYEMLHAQRLTEAAARRVDPALELLRGFAQTPPAVRDVDAALALAERLARIGLPSTRSKAFGDAAREAGRALKRARATLLLTRMTPAVEAALGLARRVGERFDELKRARSVLDNDDLIGLALAAVRDNPQVAAEYADRFKLIMVDEFQDTDARQLELVRLLAGGEACRVATVGDAQQSIYRFRGADVDVFRSHGRSVGSAGHVRMATNYRSHAAVLSFVDAVCGGGRGVLDDFMQLSPSPKRQDRYRAHDLPRVSVEVVLREGAPTSEAVDVMADSVAGRLAAFVEAGQRPGDMALLLGTTTHASAYIDAIRARGLECVVTGGSTFTSAPEVGVVASLLHVLANPHDTGEGLFPLLASELFELDADDFVMLGTRPQLVLDAPTKRSIDRGIASMTFYGDVAPSLRLRLAHDLILRARSRLRRQSVADVCLGVARESGWLARLEAQGQEGRSREANVLAAVEYVRDLTDELGMGAARAASEFDAWLQLSKVPPSTLAVSARSAVRVMTVHASKGLEFPVCAVAECWSTPRPPSGVVAGRLTGGEVHAVLAPPGARLDETCVEATDDPRDIAEVWAALRAGEREAEAQEKTRLLYVGLTRAREALVLGLRADLLKGGDVAAGLAYDVLDALFDGVVPRPGAGELEGPEGGRLGSYRCLRVSRADGATVVDGATDGPLAPDVVCSECPDRRAFDLYEVESGDLSSLVTMADARDGSFSYSSVASRISASSHVDASMTSDGADEDRATNLGSAFHELAQSLVEAPGEAPDARRLDAAARRWRLSSRSRARLETALGRWMGSALRLEALAHDVVRAELPFFQHVESVHGSHVTGAIDLLCSDEGAERALVVDYKTGDAGLGWDELRARHAMQANFYAKVLMGAGFSEVDCAFCCVERDAAELGGVPGQPVVVRWHFDEREQPRW